MSSDAGALVTETLAYDGGRPVTAYVPPEPPQAVVFAADGPLIARWGAFLNEAANLPPTMIVAAHRLADETERLHIRAWPSAPSQSCPSSCPACAPPRTTRRRDE